MASILKTNFLQRRITISLIFILSLWMPLNMVASAGPLVGKYDARPLHIYGSNDFPPYEYINEKGQPEGFNVDIIRAIMKELHLPYKIILQKWAHVLENYKVGKADIIMGMSYNIRRSEQYKFGMSYVYLYPSVIYRRGEKPVKRVAQLIGKKVLVERGDILCMMLNEAGLTKEIIPVDNMIQGFKALAEGEADAAISVKETALYAIDKYKLNNLNTNELNLFPEEYGYVSNDPTLLSEMDKVLIKLKNNGTYQRIYTKWFSHTDTNTIKEIIYYSIGGLVLCAIIFLLFIRLLRHKVNQAKMVIKEQSRQLEESNRKMKYAIKSSDLVLWELEVATHLFSSYNEKLLGFEENKRLFLEDMEQFIYPGDLSRVRAMKEKLLLGKDITLSFDFRVWYQSDSSWHYCNITATPIAYDNKGNVTRYVGFRRDNTTVIKLNEDLRSFSNKMDYMLKSSGINIWEYDLKTRQIKVLSGVNDVQEVIPCEEYFARLSPEDKDDVMALYAKMDKGEIDSFSNKRKMNHPRGKEETRYIIFNGIALYDANHKVTSYFGLRRDITDFITIQDKLKEETKKAQMADRLKSAFLANVSHEIRTPLNSIVGFSNLLQETPEADKKAEYIKLINKNNELLLQLIDDIIALSKIESGTAELQCENFDMAGTFNEMAKTLNPKCRNNGLDFIADNPYSRCIIKCDKYFIMQILTHFTSNSIKFTTKGYIKVGYTYKDKGIMLYTEDTGIGIPESKKELVFQRFEKVNNFSQGTGLGLTVCKAITDICKGKIGFTSEENKGSYFWAWLPCELIDSSKSDQNSSNEIKNIMN